MNDEKLTRILACSFITLFWILICLALSAWDYNGNKWVSWMSTWARQDYKNYIWWIDLTHWIFIAVLAIQWHFLNRLFKKWQG